MYLLKMFYLKIISWVIPIGETEFRGNARSVKESVLAWSMKLPTHRKESLKKHAIHTMQKILIDSLPFFRNIQFRKAVNDIFTLHCFNLHLLNSSYCELYQNGVSLFTSDEIVIDLDPIL
jgi:hypothetical protein